MQLRQWDKSAENVKSSVEHSLDSLAELDSETLRRLYVGAPEPKALTALDGHPRGRMLATVFTDTRRGAHLLRRLARARAFPWGGKSFQSQAVDRGQGVNRVALGWAPSTLSFSHAPCPIVHRWPGDHISGLRAPGQS